MAGDGSDPRSPWPDPGAAYLDLCTGSRCSAKVVLVRGLTMTARPWRRSLALAMPWRPPVRAGLPRQRPGGRRCGQAPACIWRAWGFIQSCLHLEAEASRRRACARASPWRRWHPRRQGWQRPGSGFAPPWHPHSATARRHRRSPTARCKPASWTRWPSPQLSAAVAGVGLQIPAAAHAGFDGGSRACKLRAGTSAAWRGRTR